MSNYRGVTDHLTSAKPSSLRLVCWMLLLFIIGAFTFLYYRHALGFWWSHDDAHHLKFALQHSVADYLFDPQIYRKFHDLYLAPWNILAYSINLSLFGMEPKFFYLRHICSLAALAFTTSVLLRHWMSTAWALFASLLLIIAPATAVVVSQLMDTHYLEGMLFSCIAATCYVNAVRSERLWVAILGALFYFLATASKEIFVPLSMVLLFLPVASLPDRIKAWTPYLFVAIFYVVWRSVYIQDSFGSWIYLLNFETLLIFPWRLATFVYGAGPQAQIGIAVTLVTLFFVVYKNLRWLPFLAVALVGLLVPLLPVAGAITVERFHILTSWSLIVLWVSLMHHVSTRSNKMSVLSICMSVGFAYLVLIESRVSLDRTVTTNLNYAVVGKFVFEQPSDRILYLPNYQFAGSDIASLRFVAGMGHAPSIRYDPLQFSDKQQTPPNLYFYDQSVSGIVKVTDLDVQILNDWRESILEKPLSLSLVQHLSGVDWRFGPYTDSGYSVIILPDKFSFTRVPGSGFYRARLRPMQFRLRYSSPEGWVTYSDEQIWTAKEGESLAWSRP